MPDPGPFHATLGQSWRTMHEPYQCSKCGTVIDDDDVPLILFSESTNLAWTYCLACGEAIVRAALARKKPD